MLRGCMHGNSQAFCGSGLANYRVHQHYASSLVAMAHQKLFRPMDQSVWDTKRSPQREAVVMHPRRHSDALPV